MTSIPVVDLAPYLSDPRGQGLEHVANQVSDACLDAGAFYLSNHDIASSVPASLFAVAQEFFALPEEKKNSIHISNSELHRGYFPVGEESAKGSTVSDLKEGFDMALELPPEDPDVVAEKQSIY